MNTQENNFNCTNTEEGSLVARYEMDWLSETECKKFEDHMMACDFCAAEVQVMLPLARVMRNHKSELVTELHKSGLSFESLKQEFLANAPKKVNENGLFDKIKTLLNRKVWIPALVGAAALVIIFNQVDFKTNYRMGPTINMQEIVRDNSPTDVINQGIEKYQQKDYKEAVELFRKVVKQVPESAQVFYYLGASAYCLKDDKLALESLTKADDLSQHSIPDASYYLALLHKDRNEFDKAVPILERMIQQQQDQNGRAKKLLEEIKSAK